MEAAEQFVQLDLLGKSKIDILEERMTKQHEEYDRFRRHHFWSNSEMLKMYNVEKDKRIEIEKELEEVKKFIGMGKKESQCQVYCMI